MDVLKKVCGAVFALIISAITVLLADLLGSFICGIVLELVDIDNVGSAVGWILGSVMFVARALLFSCAAGIVYLLIGKIYRDNARLASIAAGIGGLCIPIACIAYGKDFSASLGLLYFGYVLFFIRVNSGVEKQSTPANINEIRNDAVYWKADTPIVKQQIEANKPLTFSKKTILNETENKFNSHESVEVNIALSEKKDGNASVSNEKAFPEAVNILAVNRKQRDKGKIVLIVVLIISIIFSGLIFIHYEVEKNDLLEQQSSMEKEISTLKKKNFSLDKKADDYDKIIKSLKKGNVGYASNYFKLNKGILYLSPGEKEKVTLTTAWSRGCTVYYDNSSEKVATFNFNEDNWNEYTTLTIEAKKEGVTIITLSNSIDSKELRLIVIVD